jgi:hypothetical protein
MIEDVRDQAQDRINSGGFSESGKPAAGPPSLESRERVRDARERFDELSGRIAGAYAGVPSDAGVAEIDAVVARIRRG